MLNFKIQQPLYLLFSNHCDEAYIVDEHDVLVQPLLVLSNPSSFVEIVQLISTDITANGNENCVYICSIYSVILVSL